MIVKWGDILDSQSNYSYVAKVNICKTSGFFKYNITYPVLKLYDKYVYHDVDVNEVTKIINKYELLDMNKLCKLILSCEGYSTTLATFDHEEILLGEYYGYFIGF